MKKKIIAKLLNLANRQHPALFRSEFYSLKEILLKKYGYVAGQVAQRITKKCLLCGAGEGTIYGSCIYKCPDCNGTGLFKDETNILTEYRLDRYRFLIPFMKIQGAWPFTIDHTIEGYIEHQEPQYFAGYEATFWLFLLFDFNSFLKLFKINLYFFNLTPKTPLLYVHKLYWKIKSKWRRINDNEELPF